MTSKEIKNLIILELVAPSYTEEIYNDAEPQEIRDKIYQDYKSNKSNEQIFSHIEDKNKRKKYISLFNELDGIIQDS